MENGCWLPLRASQIAREKGLLEKGKELVCPYAQGCLGIAQVGVENCEWLNKLSENPPFRTIYLKQGGKPPPPSPMERFYNRLNRTAEMRGLR